MAHALNKIDGSWTSTVDGTAAQPLAVNITLSGTGTTWTKQYHTIEVL
jgi:hypothetical protein